jgi:ubiquinone/menaquinone biosynthesis C-methylase UbiE
MSKKNGILKEWDKASDSWADFVREGKDYFRDEMNNPAAFKMMGNVRGKHVLDLSCGEGYNTRILAKKGACVVGVDFSKKMIRLAKQAEEHDKLGISYLVSDAANLREFEKERFDVVMCLMALMDIERYEDAISEVARVLKKNGKFVFSMTHPCFEWGKTEDGETLAEWKSEEGADESVEPSASYLAVRNYSCVAKCEIEWTMKRLVKHFKTTSFHRTLTDYFQALHKSGLSVTRLVEPKPTLKGMSKHPPLNRHTRIPHSIVIEATKFAKN